MDNEFCLISSILSPSCPPLAAIGLLTVTESKTYCANDVLPTCEVTKEILPSPILFIWPALILAAVPPPVKYLTVKVVFEGAIP